MPGRPVVPRRLGSAPSDSLWERARHEGFEVETFERNAAGREKKVDTTILATIIKGSFRHMQSERGDLAVLVAGDGDYMPAVEGPA